MSGLNLTAALKDVVETATLCQPETAREVAEKLEQRLVSHLTAHGQVTVTGVGLLTVIQNPRKTVSTFDGEAKTRTTKPPRNQFLLKLEPDEQMLDRLNGRPVHRRRIKKLERPVTLKGRRERLMKKQEE